MTPMVKTWLALVLPAIALFEYWTAMRAFGKKDRDPNMRHLLRLHRLFGYVFLFWFLWICWAGVDLITRMGFSATVSNPRVFVHILMALTLLMILLLKIQFIRFYRNYRPYVPLLGIVVSLGVLVLWGISGWLYLLMR